MTTKCSLLKMLAPDGKTRLMNVMEATDIFRTIKYIPSSKHLKCG